MNTARKPIQLEMRIRDDGRTEVNTESVAQLIGRREVELLQAMVLSDYSQEFLASNSTRSDGKVFVTMDGLIMLDAVLERYVDEYVELITAMGRHQRHMRNARISGKPALKVIKGGAA